MRTPLILASTLALSLGAASAQTTTTTTAAPAQVTLSDVPAGHWAKDAVDRIVQCGLIQGFPDGTFRGNENLTRYQAALIFYRALQAGALANCGFNAGDMTVVANGMQEVSTELAAIATRVTDLERLSAEQQARIDALEARIAAVGTVGTGTASADVTALQARIDALEAAIRNIPAGPAGPAGPTGPQGPAGPAGTQGPAGTSASGTVTTTPPVTTTPTTVVIGDPIPTTAPEASRGLYAGVAIGAKTAGANSQCLSLGGNAANRTRVNYCLNGTAIVGSSNVIGPVGARAAVEYAPGYNGVSADVNATYEIGAGGSLTPYVGAGLGLTSSQARSGSTVNATTNATDVYGNVLLGADFRVTDSIAVFVEGNGRYYLTNKGAGTGLASTSSNGFTGGVKAGLKFYF